MSLFGKIVTFIVWAVLTGVLSGAIGNAMGNPDDAGKAWIAFLLAGLVALTAVRKRRGASAA